jgi:hypothetical protein
MHYGMLTIASSIAWKLIGLLILYLLGGSANQWRHTLAFLLLGAAVEGVFSIWIYKWFEKFDWLTFKHFKVERAMDEELDLDHEGF